MMTHATTTHAITTHAMTVDEFCHSHRISRGTFYNLLKGGQGPAIMKIGSGTRISEEAAMAWRRQMETRGQMVAA